MKVSPIVSVITISARALARLRRRLSPIRRFARYVNVALAASVTTRRGRVRPDVIHLTVVVPTIGRPTLERTLDSAREAFEVLVVGDNEFAEAAVQGRSGVRYHKMAEGTGKWGYPQREAGVSNATGTHICFMDDDDEFAPGVLKLIQKKVAKAPDRVHIFRMRFEGGERDRLVLWQEPLLKIGNIGAQMIVVPNDGLLGKWGQQYQGDFDFLTSTLRARGQEPIWHRHVTALVHWERTPEKFARSS